MEALGATGVIAAIVAVVVGLLLGTRRGVDNVASRANEELKRLVEAQTQRIAMLEKRNVEMESEIKELRTEVASLRRELDIEKRITARLEGR